MVTPFAGVWIEIVKCTMRIMLLVSLPSRECGLKYLCTSYLIRIINRHSLRGSVD